MNLNNLWEFLEKFDIKKVIIDEYLENKRIVEVNNNIFLINKNSNFDKTQIYDNGLIFIQLKLLLPSTFLLNFIKLNSPNIINVKSKKTVLAFTYSKSLNFEQVKVSNRVSPGKFYLTIFEDKVLGYVSLDEKMYANAKNMSNSRYFPLINKMNIGEYLKEN